LKIILSKLLGLIFIIISITACTSTPQLSIKKDILKVESIPSEYKIIKKDKNKLYGVGIGKSMNSAIDNALIDCLSRLSVNVENKITKITKTNRNTINKIFIKKSIQKIKDTYTSEYYIERFTRLKNNIIVKISLKKQELINNIILNIINEENNLKSFHINDLKNKNILSRIDLLSNAIEQSKDIDVFINMLSFLNKKYTLKSKSKTATYEKILKKDINHINIYFKNKMNPNIYNNIKSNIVEQLKINIKITDNYNNAKLTSNDLLFTLSSCADGYTALRMNRKFWQSGQIKIYNGCNKLTIKDNNGNDIYSNRIKGIKIKDYKKVNEASIKSYLSKNSQNELKKMLTSFSTHTLLKYLKKEDF